jgi:hypothetical protein
VWLPAAGLSALVLVAFRFGLAQALNALPDPLNACLAILHFLGRRHPRQAVPNRHQPLVGPRSGQLRQLLQAGEGIKGGSVCGGGFFWVSKRRDVVLFIDGESRHGVFLCAALTAVITSIAPI